jgi:hypothetical protein
MQGVKFEPVAMPSISRPGDGLFLVGVAYPAVVVLIELLSRFCATSLFDPMPTWGHVAAVSFVPASNLLLWTQLRRATLRHPKWLAFISGTAIAIGAFYALLFLPLFPLAVVAILVVIGLLPLAPLAAFASAVVLYRTLRARCETPHLARALIGGLAVGVALLLILDVPVAATRLGIQWAMSDTPSERERGLMLLRTLGNDDLLLRLCYGAANQPVGLLSAFAMFADGLDFRDRRRVAVPLADAREIYYRVHGVPFNAKPAPFENASASRLADFQFDNDHGGTQVGGRLKGLHMVASRLDGSISGDDAVAYLEWTVEFRNSEATDREARLQLALPPNGVVSRATLWVNGEEREAAYGGRGAVRAAYQKVAVQQRRDPLLVTTKGADRVLAQAFPVPRNGGTIKFKLGITAPLEVVEPGKARLTLPALVDRNFSFAADMGHSVWIESKRPLAWSDSDPAAGGDGSPPFRLTGTISDRDLSSTRQAITVDRDPSIRRLLARIGDDESVVQTISQATQPATSLMLVVDGSARVAGVTPQLIRAMEAIPPGIKVGVIIAAEPVQRVTPAAWSPAQKQKVTDLLRMTRRYGGQDNAPALIEALTTLEAEPQATLLWVHGPQPVSFRGSAERLEQASARLSRLPRVVLYSVEPGPNELLPDAPWAWSAVTLPNTASLETDLEALFRRWSNQTPVLAVQRSVESAADGVPKGSDHVARLWASDRVLELMRTDPNGNRAAAVALATRYHLVTPVSGAVVLETKQQYDENGLTPVAQATVPTVPEPHEWALLLIACAAFAWLAWRNRQQVVPVTPCIR